jgi:hypothetical protein
MPKYSFETWKRGVEWLMKLSVAEDRGPVEVSLPYNGNSGMCQKIQKKLIVIFNLAIKHQE